MIAGVHTGSDKAKSFKSATIALAVLLGVVVVAAAAAIFWLTRKNKSLRGQVPADQPAPDMTQQQQQPYHDNSHNHDAAVHSAAPAYEAHADSTPAHSVTGSPVPQWANKPGDGYGQQQQHRYSELDGTSLANTQDQRTPGSPPLQSPDFRIAEARED